MKKTLAILFGLLMSVSLFAQNDKPYDEQANAMEQINTAVAQANAEGKYVLCQVGGNWCPWCLRFSQMAESDTTIHQIIDQNFVYIHVNFSQKNKNQEAMKRLQNPGRFGFPVFVILDGEGNVIHIQIISEMLINILLEFLHSFFLFCFLFRSAKHRVQKNSGTGYDDKNTKRRDKPLILYHGVFSKEALQRGLEGSIPQGLRHQATGRGYIAVSKWILRVLPGPLIPALPHREYGFLLREDDAYSHRRAYRSQACRGLHPRQAPNTAFHRAERC